MGEIADLPVFKVSRNGRERRSHTSNFLHISVPTPRIGVAKRSRMGVPTPNFYTLTTGAC